MRIWLTCFGVLFAIAEFCQWVEHLTLPLPVYILGGALLVIASNYNKRIKLPWLDESSTVIAAATPPNLPQPTSAPQPPRSISFTIRRSSEESQPAEE
ncbi:MAG: hypothetical protein JOZ78_05345 [Chroococcidiopsidaceae cyanobacterium CP_BM_ER_R8_30]|nr:hypothetical protein [Chroococcidiopsidaceae cyanobacterium CP_BM_ER_R8_30]